VRIPVFVSCPTALAEAQEESRSLVLRELELFGLEPRALGRTDYPVDTPLREVLVIARHCAGGVILGFSQTVTHQAVGKPGTSEETDVRGQRLPTPWNHLEAGILYAIGLPLLIFREPGIAGGIFDIGTTETFIHPMPTTEVASDPDSGLHDVFLKWQSRVRQRYYQAE
jgi:hypothetical protein